MPIKSFDYDPIGPRYTGIFYNNSVSLEELYSLFYFYFPRICQGYYRRSEALKGLGRHEDALLSLLHCAAMERSLMCDVRDDIAKVFFFNI